MTLADQIIEHGTYVPGDAVWAEGLRAVEMNALRDELIELRQLRAAAETRKQPDEVRFAVDTHVFRNKPSLTLVCDGCASWTAIIDGPTWLAELNRRADQHAEECR